MKKKKNNFRGKKPYEEDIPKDKSVKNKKRKKNKTMLKDLAKGNVYYYDYIDEVEEGN